MATFSADDFLNGMTLKYNFRILIQFSQVYSKGRIDNK